MKISLILATVAIFSTLIISIHKISTTDSQNQTLFVFAAASLTHSFEELGAAYTTTTGIPVTFNFAGSSTLAAQIENGAQADIFASADIVQMQRLTDSHLISTDNVTTFAENRLTLIVPSDNPATIMGAQDLTKPDILLVMASPSVPVREYTEILLMKLASYYDNIDYTASIEANIISEETHVRQVVARVALGEADAAFVYRTDLTPDIVDNVREIALPYNTSPIAQYPIAPLVESDHTELARDFIDFVLSDEGQAILQTWGFCAPQADNFLTEEDVCHS